MEQLKKYKLQDLVANGSHVRRKVNSDLLVGNTSFGYGYGDIFDANATAQLMEEKLEELNIEDINREDINQLKQKDIEHDNEITTLATRVSTNEGDLTALKAGASTEGSVAYQIAQIVNENNNGSIDTLNEIAAWIVSDTTGVAKMVADINSLSNVKTDKVDSATAGNFAGLDANGNMTDSGAKASDFATAAQGAKADTAVQDASYVHTDNNYTTAEKSKLAAVSASVSGDTLTITTIAA